MSQPMRPEDRRAAILIAATSCFSEAGYHSTQVSDIIRRAGIARGTFYLYFKSKHEIFQCILDEFISHLSSRILVIELGGKKSPAVQVRENVERVLDAVLERPALGKIIFSEAVGLDESTQERLKLFYKRLLDIIRSSICRGISLGVVRSVNADVAACVILGAVKEIITQNTILENIRINRQTVVDGLIDVVVGGLGGMPMLGQ